jgi:hypothetical protein
MLTGSDSEEGKAFSFSGTLAGPVAGSEEVGEATQFKDGGPTSATAGLEVVGIVSVFLLGALSM